MAIFPGEKGKSPVCMRYQKTLGYSSEQSRQGLCPHVIYSPVEWPSLHWYRVIVCLVIPALEAKSNDAYDRGLT